VQILFVEDDPLIREFVVEALHDEGFHVIQAGDGEEALAWCMQRVADVLVTDIQLPGPDRRVADRGALSRARSRTSSDLRDRFFSRRGPSGPGQSSLQKPYHPEQIVQAVRQATEGRNAPKLQ
jgi:CheY-like chemotaxis protein